MMLLWKTSQKDSEEKLQVVGSFPLPAFFCPSFYFPLNGLKICSYM